MGEEVEAHNAPAEVEAHNAPAEVEVEADVPPLEVEVEEVEPVDWKLNKIMHL